MKRPSNGPADHCEGPGFQSHLVQVFGSGHNELEKRIGKNCAVGLLRALHNRAAIFILLEQSDCAEADLRTANMLVERESENEMLRSQIATFPASLNELLASSYSLDNDKHDRRESALGAYDRAITMYRKLIYELGRTDLLGDLAITLTNRSAAVRVPERKEESADNCREAIQILQRLLARGHSERFADLARAYLNLAWDEEAYKAELSTAAFAELAQDQQQAIIDYCKDRNRNLVELKQMRARIIADNE